MAIGSKETQTILKRHSILPSRSLGQNFVIDPNTIRKVVRVAELQQVDQILEIGAGLGSLTSEFNEAKKIVAIEFDRYLIPALNETLERAAMIEMTEILHEDAMNINWHEFFSTRPGDWKMVSNLPYNIASPLLLNLLDHAPQVTKLVVMVQREVGERFAAEVGTSSYGIPSVKAQYWADVSIVGRIPPNVFFPAPKVDSVLLEFSRRRNVEPVELGVLWRLVQTGFGQRRKMLRKSLRKLVETQDFVRAGIDPTLRPQDLNIEDWISLANEVGSED
ncbi:MAG: 16S rRNA (adenine(1518)-N(6)/adenine(1519)-N(6))-dimethyltransferase RsmA, partial [Actinomycetota bacterium]|nr:16S rRNA (adenine(1518)-N(6)/adenine(1519)-N(6))-dimethyltransferase RsmA [Actinomycetota bacterium]